MGEITVVVIHIVIVIIIVIDMVIKTINIIIATAIRFPYLSQPMINLNDNWQD